MTSIFLLSLQSLYVLKLLVLCIDYRVTELCSILEPGGAPKRNKVAIINDDAVGMVNQALDLIFIVSFTCRNL